MLEIGGVSVPFLPVRGVGEGNFIENQGGRVNHGTPFSEVFAEELGKIKFSGHALTRMASRDIGLSDGEITRLESAIEKAEVKQSIDSLVMLDEKAFIVNIPNKTVITMFMRDNMDDGIVTKIDSAVFA
ncbi:MAG: flagellar protein [Candidatus Kapabacteria bacterium]|nr:flagellar protein [Ignavibacteriota bacterium]MCW5886473.1 flagellar protein [Candidatus Kapabacteria bacterium]